LWRFEVQFHRFLEVGKGLFLGVPLAGDVEFEAVAANGRFMTSLFHRQGGFGTSAFRRDPTGIRDGRSFPEEDLWTATAESRQSPRGTIRPRRSYRRMEPLYLPRG